MAERQKNDVPDLEPSNTHFAVPRREQRHPVPAVYQRHIHLKVKIDNELVPVLFQDFSSFGVLFESHVPFEIESRAEGVISMPRSLSREIAFNIRVRHCEKKNDAFLVGAAIETTDDETWMNIIREVYDYIMERQGDVY
jgi:hypothetical protein